MNHQDLARYLRRAGRNLILASEEIDGTDPDPVPPTPPGPSPSRMMLGAEVERVGTSKLAEFRRFQDTAGGLLNMRVTYTRGIPATFEDHPAYGGGMVGAAWSSLSVKTFDLEKLRSFMESIPEPQRPYTIVTAWHEPEDNIMDGEFSVEEWTRLQAGLAEIGEHLGILTAACLMAWTWDPRSGRNPNAYADGVSFHPVFAIDGYDDTGRASPMEIFGRPVADSADWGAAAWMIRETGTARDKDGASIEWWSQLWDWAEASGATAVCPWDSNRRSDWPWCALDDNERAHLGFLAAQG